MNFVQYIGFKLDTAIEMLKNPEKSRDECMCYLMGFKKELFKTEKVVIDTSTSCEEIEQFNLLS